MRNTRRIPFCSLVVVCSLVFLVTPAAAQKRHLLEACGGATFYYTISEVLNSGGKQQIQISVDNPNRFRIHVAFKLRVLSEEGGTFTDNPT